MHYPNAGWEIKPVKSIDDWKPLGGRAWQHVMSSDSFYRNLIAGMYVRGFWDAMGLCELHGDPQIKKLSAEFEGMDMDEMLKKIEKFYQEHPDWKDVEPAIVMTSGIPEAKRGLRPIHPQSKGSKTTG